MRNRTCKRPGTALLLLASVAYTAAAHAADDSFALGGVLGYGDNTRIYGLQAVWAPQRENEALASHDLGLRLTAQIARWVASISGTPYHSLIDTSVMAELRYWGTGAAPVRPFIEAGFGLHLLSHVHIANRNMTTAFDFGSQAAVGFAFGDRGQYELAALINHVSNGGIKYPNDGLTYGGIRLRVALQ
jgi:lipid A 3-O-deacylase